MAVDCGAVCGVFIIACGAFASAGVAFASALGGGGDTGGVSCGVGGHGVETFFTNVGMLACHRGPCPEEAVVLFAARPLSLRRALYLLARLTIVRAALVAASYSAVKRREFPPRFPLDVRSADMGRF